MEGGEGQKGPPTSFSPVTCTNVGFADITKIVTMFFKTIIKDSIKFKRIRNYVSKCILYLYFLI